jgi:hypothetical protein
MEAFSMPETLTARQQQTLNGRQALADQFPSPEARTEHYRALGRRSAERRITLSGDEAVALVDAYSLLSRIAERARLKLGGAPNEAAQG